MLHRTLLCGTLLLRLAAAADGSSVRQDRRARRAATEEEEGCRVGQCLFGCCMLGVSTVGDVGNTCCVKPAVCCGTTIGSCVCGTWKLLPTCQECLTGGAKCADDICKCGCGVVTFVCKDGCYDGCLKGCCWEGLYKGCLKPCKDGDWVEPCGTCLTDSRKCCGDTLAGCGEACAGGCVGAVGACVGGAQACGACCREFPWGMRCLTCADLEAGFKCLGDCGMDCLLGCRDNCLCYQSWPTLAECGAGCGSCAAGCGGCMACMLCAPVECAKATPECLRGCNRDCLTPCATGCSDCVRGTPDCLRGCNRECLQPCLHSLSASGEQCISSIAGGCHQGLCVSLPANTHALYHRAGAFVTTTGMMRAGQTVSKALPRNVQHYNVAGAIKGKQMSALSNSAGKRPWANLKPRTRQLMSISEAKAQDYTEDYNEALDKKWATSDAWVGFWRGDAARDIEGRNDKLARYLKEFRFKYNKAMCDYMDEKWYPSWHEHYRSYNDQYMEKLALAGKVPRVPATDEEYAELEHYLMSKPEMMDQFGHILETYVERRGQIRDERAAAGHKSVFEDRLRGEPSEWQRPLIIGAPAREPAFVTPAQRPPAQPRATPQAAPQGGLGLTQSLLEPRPAAPVARPAAPVAPMEWTCRKAGCNVPNHVQYNPKQCRKCGTPKQA